MGKSKVAPVQIIVPDQTIIQRYWAGSNVKQLTDFVAGAEQTTKREAKEKVEWVLLNHIKSEEWKVEARR